MPDPRRRVLDPAALAAAKRAAFAQNATATARTARKRAPVAAVPFGRVCEAVGLPAPVAEYRFEPTRKWRFDWCWPDQRVALEVDGGIWTQGRHTRGAGWEKDTEKLNAAQAAGWRVLRCTPTTRDTPATLDALRAALTLTEVRP